jgi:hypothetical protein
VSLALKGLLILAIAGSSACTSDTPTGPTSLVVDPPGPITMQVGQTTTIKATAIVNGNPSYATYSSSNSSVASVDSATGLVRCLSQGNAIISVTGGGTTKSVDVACGAAVLIDLAPTTLSFSHSVGVTACPQLFGTVRVANVSSGVVTVTLSPSGSALTLDAASATVQAGGSVDFNVSFNCSLQQSFSATILVSATSGPATDFKTVTVQASISR